jgi:hypothetical protein
MMGLICTCKTDCSGDGKRSGIQYSGAKMVQRGPLNDTVSYPIALRTVNLTHVRNLRYASSQGQACPARREREEGKGRCRVGPTTSTCKKCYNSQTN